MRKLLFTVNGMSCAGCQANVEATALEIEGVKEASVNLADKTLTVFTTDNKALEEKIVKAITEKGYPTQFDRVVLEECYDHPEACEEEACHEEHKCCGKGHGCCHKGDE